MKPLQLTLSGFRSHMDETSIDFGGRSLFAIVGPTGAGKSSILDAISYALYGRTPRVQRSTKALICSRSEAARVRLRFSVDGREHDVTRVVRRKGTSEHVLLEPTSGARTIGDASVTARITETIGLGFSAFCSSVLLAQNQFARFLEAPPGEQMDILKGVFRVDQVDGVRKAARGKTSDIDLELSEVAGKLSMIPGDAAQRLQTTEDALRTTAERVDTLAAAVATEEALKHEAAALSEELARCEQDAERVRRWVARIPDAEALQDVVTAERRLRDELEAAASALEKARARAGRAAAELQSVQERFGMPAELGILKERADRWARAVDALAALHGQQTEARRRADAAREGAQAALGRAQASERALEEARARRRAVEQAHRAHALRAELEPGAPCPVCEQVVGNVPARRPPQALGAVEAQERDAQECAEAGRRAHAAAHAEAAGADRDVEGLRARIDEEEAALSALELELRAALGEADDPVAAVAGRMAAVEAAARQERAASRTAEEARALHDDVAAAERTTAAALQKVASTLIHVCGEAGLDAPESDAEADALLGCAAQLRAAAAEALDGASGRARDAAKLLEQATGRLGDLRERLGVVASYSVAVAAAEARAELEAARADVQRLRADVATQEDLRARAKALSDERALYARITDDLTDSKFIKFLLEDRRRLLSELGSEQLQALTGRYRFDDDAEFNIVDEFDAEKRRDIDTLSGGEMFLASLALALGLADAVGRQGGRLQSFFLDEGFGSLDPESLDQALDGIERIVARDRVIGVVSHVRAVAERIDDKIELDKGPDGMTVIRR